MFCENVGDNLPSIFRWSGSGPRRSYRMRANINSSFLGILGAHGLQSYQIVT